MKKLISVLLAGAIGLSMLTPAFAAESTSVKVYVDCTLGNDNNDGMQVTSAVKTIQKAQELAREYKQADKKTEVIIMDGTYVLEDTLEFTAEDSGASVDAPVIYRAYQDANVTLTMGKEVTGFELSTSALIPSEAYGYVYEADLSDFDNLTGGFTETIYQNGQLAQVSKEDTSIELETLGLNDGSWAFCYFEPEALSGRNDRTDIYWECTVNGYTWNLNPIVFLYEDGEYTDMINAGAAKFDTSGNLANVTGNIRNTIEGIDSPGEYYIDAANKVLYYYPVADFAVAPVYMATNGKTDMISIDNAENIKFENINLNCGNGNAFTLTDTDNISIYKVSMKAFNNAIVATETSNLTVASATIDNMKTSGITLSGGDQTSLTESANIVRNSTISNIGMVYKSSARAIKLSAIGDQIINNNILNTSSVGIEISGNDNLIENNRVGNTMLTVWDSGAIYLGRSWANRGNKINNNFIYTTKDVIDYGTATDSHYYGSGTDNMAIYLDDMQADVEVTGNVIYNMSMGVMLSGTNDVTYSNNTHIDCRRGMHFLAGGQGWNLGHLDELYQYKGYIYNGLKALFASEGYDEAEWIAQYGEGYEEMLSDLATYDEATAESTANIIAAYTTTDEETGKTTFDAAGASEAALADAERQAALKTLAIARRNTVSNNVFTGEWAEWSAGGSKPAGVTQTDTPLAHFTVQSQITNEATNSVAGGYTVSARSSVVTSEDGNDLVLANGTDTSTIGIGTETYVPSYSTNEYDVNDGNRFTAIAAIYDNAGKLVSITTDDNVFVQNGQLVDMEIAIPEEAETGWSVKIMTWDKLSGIKPVAKNTLTIN